MQATMQGRDSEQRRSRPDCNSHVEVLGDTLCSHRPDSFASKYAPMNTVCKTLTGFGYLAELGYQLAHLVLLLLLQHLHHTGTCMPPACTFAYTRRHQDRASEHDFQSVQSTCRSYVAHIRRNKGKKRRLDCATVVLQASLWQKSRWSWKCYPKALYSASRSEGTAAAHKTGDARSQRRLLGSCS